MFCKLIGSTYSVLMVPVKFGRKVPGEKHCRVIDTLELKHHIEMSLGKTKADRYFSLVKSYLCLRVTKSVFDKLCIGLFGRESVHLHNRLIRSVLRNALSAMSSGGGVGKVHSSLNMGVSNGCQSSNLEMLCRDMLPRLPRRGRTPVVRRRRSAFGHSRRTGNVVREVVERKLPESESGDQLLSLSSRRSAEEGVEVERGGGSPEILSRSPLIAPLGVSIPSKESRRSSAGFFIETCCNSGELPDSVSLKNMMERKLGMDSFTVSMDAANLMNNALNVFLKGLIKPCLDLASSLEITGEQKPSLSLADLGVVIHRNPLILGEGWSE